ncbi:MAG: DUF3825 domain-containing protein [Bifidobacteriaceae bacterium]|nr:DUF3825 domain-containing protein [Bifidobacteriaceae bacterium]
MLLRAYAFVPRQRWLDLANLAQPEQWGFQRDKPDRPFPILRTYLNYTFRRAWYQDKVAELGEGDERRAVFNTGLATIHYEAIYGHLAPNRPKYDVNPSRDPQPYYVQAFCPRSDSQLMVFRRLPDRATYFDHPADLLYDTDLDLRVQYKHIVNQHVDRFPAALRDDDRRRTEAVRQAIEHAKFRVEQNYKTAVPQFYWKTPDDSDAGRLQLLVPLCLEDITRADLALSIDREGDVYRAATVLTLDMAYGNARLVARP